MPTNPMKTAIHRRAALGLAIQGPFSRNRRRRSLRESGPALLATGLVLGLAAFLTALFS